MASGCLKYGTLIRPYPFLLLTLASVISGFGSVSFILPDTGFHQALNQGLAPHVVCHEFFQLLLKALPARAKCIGFIQVDKGAAGLVIGQARSPFDGLPDRLPRLGKFSGQLFQIRLALLAATDLALLPVTFCFSIRIF